MLGPLIRVLLYMLAGLLLGELIRLDLGLEQSRNAYTEFAWVQVIQAIFLAAGTALLFLNARRIEYFRQLSVCMALFFFALLIRENDQVFELFLPHGAWTVIVLFPVAALLVYFWRHRRATADQLSEFSGTFSFGVMMGSLAVLAFSRMFGRKGYWQELMGIEYQRTVKLAAEESIELLALGLALIAIIEFWIYSGRHRPAD